MFRIKLNYKYTKKKLFEEIERYQFTPFYGEEFLDAYKESRTNILDKIKVQKFEIERIFDSIYEKTDGQKHSEVFVTEYELIKIIHHGFTENIKILNKIIKRFEITKKIFGKYDLMLDKNLSEKKSLRNYILLSIICLKRFEKDRNLKFLNCSLKLNDIICSVFNDDIHNNDLYMINFVLRKELDVIEKLQMRE